MCTLQAESEPKHELNDSGYGQDESLTMKKQLSLDNGYIGTTQLLDLSDDVLLYILKHCCPRDLKALGFTCPRLGTLVLDRTLWERVDARDHSIGQKRIRWLLKHALTAATTELLLTGYAKEADGCLGLMNCKRSYMEPEDLVSRSRSAADSNSGLSQSTSDDGGATAANDAENSVESNRSDETANRPRVEIFEMHRPATGFPAIWPDPRPDGAVSDTCPGPQYSLTPQILKRLAFQCPKLTSLALEYCNIDCRTRNISHFPRTLKKLSLRGSKCYNQPMDKSFLFKIQDYLTELEELEVSECEWIEPSALLPLSKLPSLRALRMRRCCKLTEFVAYASLATRYGFKNLKVIDLRESPVGDSEVSSFGWVASLEELYVSPAPEASRGDTHSHYIDDVLPEHVELEPWEVQEPEYFKSKTSDNSKLFTNGANSEQAGQSYQTERDGNTSKYTFENGIYGHNSPQKRKRDDVPRVCSCTSVLHLPMLRRFDEYPSDDDDSDDDDGDDAIQPKRSRQNGVNEGASTSKTIAESMNTSTEPSTSTCQKPEGESTVENNPKFEKYVRFRQNEDPVVINRRVDDPEDVNDNNNDSNNEQRNQEPLHKILYVNVGRRLHTMYRLSMPVYTVGDPRELLLNLPARRLDIRTEILGPFGISRFDPTTLVTDSTVHRFGRADGDNINYINIGPNGIQNDFPGTRPDRSNLRVLSITGFRNITNRSLVHLATAAPQLRLVDFSGTRVTEQGVENFKSLRPECEVVYSKESPH